jgi:hypothetical protein
MSIDDSVTIKGNIQGRSDSQELTSAVKKAVAERTSLFVAYPVANGCAST